jgi:hypothetical protein
VTQARRSNGRPADPEPLPGIDVSIWGIADTELLAIVDDLADENGWTATLAVRTQLGENIEEIGHHSGVGSRLAWMTRFGWLERSYEQKSVWRLTAMGHAILDGGDLSATLEKALDKLSPAQRVRLTREMAQGGSRSADEIKTALRREWQRAMTRHR